MDSGADTSATAPIRSATAGRKMKSTGTAFWTAPNSNATNQSGFSALPGGSRDWSDGFKFIKNNAWFLSATITRKSSSSAFSFNRYYWETSVFSINSGLVYSNEEFGASVRCLRNLF